MTEILKIRDLKKVFSGLSAVAGVSSSLKKGEIKAIIGPNGAGKTTLFNCITGLYAPTSGQIILNNIAIEGMAPFEVNRQGIARTFQNIRLFRNMSVIENVLVGCHAGLKSGILSIIFRLPKFRKEEDEAVSRSHEILKDCNLESYTNQLAASLPYAAQRKLEIARALASNPQVLLLDEPAAGMNPTETAELAELLRNIRKRSDLSLLLIEHDMGFVMNLSDSVLVMDHGETIAEGIPDAIHKNDRVKKAYLGEDYDA